MTRVERINEAIRYMFINEGRPVKEIKKELLKYHIELDMDELMAIIISFNYIPINNRKLSVLQERRIVFRPILDSLLKIVSAFHITNKQLALYLNHKNVNYPAKGAFTKANLDTIITSYDFHYPRISGGFKSPFKNQEAINDFIESKLTDSELESITKWNELNV